MLQFMKRLFSSPPKEGDGEGARKKMPFSYVVALLLAGVALMAVSHFTGSGDDAAKPSANQPESPSEPAFLSSKETKEKVMAAYEERYEKELKAALEAIEGVDDVTVVVNLDSTELKLFEKKRSTQQQTTEESDKEGGKRTIENKSTNEEVIIIRNGEEETPLVVATKKPDIRGVLVVAKGADNLQIKKWIVEAVTRVLNVPSYRVAVLPKK
ncbi:stage III sporulation protein AG [Geobacillus genomosp. 3]|uniref:Stage III sporulation protein AG n=1 Tax=Geobacillus genomosp. 3 TaxID=1921421 RepID=S5ZEL6_GEOG3|nr:stage III sporulation protein AG [Geobacillus genomosp. 3]AGT32740.1 stage III sporulation protein AG [Geobacillus genomosp. 3]